MTSELSANQLRDQLLLELSAASISYGKVLALSTELSKLDENYVRFSIDASHIGRLGIELVAKQETAVAELVKNGYDADATQVDLIFRGEGVKGGELEIIDNGNGMSREQLVQGFMRLSTADKVDNPVSPVYRRQRAGRKGIGRFATQRLGNSLTLTTQTDGADAAYRVHIEWASFEPKGELGVVANKVERVPPSASKGTHLLIRGLREAWSEPQIRRAHRYVADLLQPLPLSNALVRSEVDPGFVVRFFRDVGDDLEVVADEYTSVLNFAVAEISGYIDEEGFGWWGMKSERLGIEIEKRGISPAKAPGEPYGQLRGARLTCFYFILSKDLVPKIHSSSIKNALSSAGGVRLYRNGFRVPPYGNDFDDWLGLDASSRSRKLLPPHSNKNFIGFVEVIDRDGAVFEETSSREGLLVNIAFEELQDFVSRTLHSAVLVLAEARGKKSKAGDPRQRQPVDQARALLDKVDSIIATAEANGANVEGLKTNAQQLRSALEAIVVTTQQVLEESEMLRILGSLGLLIGEFTHEVRHDVAGLSALTKQLRRGAGDNDAISNPLAMIEERLGALRSYLRFFDRAVADNASRGREPLEMRDVVNSFRETAEALLRRDGVKLEVEVLGYDLFTRPMHRSEWASILLNLLSNSLKAIRKAGRKGRIRIGVREDGDVLAIEFSDNGVGIPLENRERAFDAFFTTTPRPALGATEEEEVTGSGLGLKIVRDMVEGVGGEILIVDPPPGYQTCFHIEIPKAKSGEIEGYV